MQPSSEPPRRLPFQPQPSPDRIDAITIPSNTLLFRPEGVQVGVVQNGVANLAPIVIGRDFGAEVEVLSGLKRTDAIIENPADSLINGTAVRVSELVKSSEE
jgi:hypothetical protein